MTDIEEKALVLADELQAAGEHPCRAHLAFGKLLRDGAAALKQHEAFKQEVSDVMMYIRALYPTLPRNFDRFIIPKPKPDPLVAAVYEVDNGPAWDSPEDYCNKIRAALEARGFEIRSKSDDR